MQLFRIAIVVAVAALISTASIVGAQEKQSFDELWREATAGDHTLTDYGDYTMVDLGNAYYYFTKEGHYAHPGVVKRSLVQDGGRFFITLEGWSFASEAGQPGFKRWVAEFEALNRRVMEALGQQ